MSDMPVIENPTDIEPTAFWDLYSEKIVQTAIYPGRGSVTGLAYVSLGLAGEAGELCEQVKKVMRDDGNVITDDRRVKMRGELGDVVWYWAGAARELGFPTSAYVALDLCPPEIIRASPGAGTPTALVRDSLLLHRFVAAFTTYTTCLLDGDATTGTAILGVHTRLAHIYHAARVIALSLDTDLRQIGADNVDKLFSRRDRGVLKGSGSDR